MTKTRALLCTSLTSVALVASCSSAQSEKPQLQLEGTGRTCAGHLSVTPTRIAWKTPLLTCNAPYKVSAHQGQDWTLSIPPTPSCKALQTITIHKTDPTNPQSFWNVTGLARSANPTNPHIASEPSLSCSMY